MAIKQYEYFRKNDRQQQEIDRLILGRVRGVDKSLYRRILQDLRSGKIEYEPIEFYRNGLIGIIVRSDILSKGEISFHTRENNILQYDAAFVAALIAQGMKQGWLFYLPDECVFC